MEIDVTQPDWWYDDLKQIGLDFEDEAEVATYDARQGGSIDADRALLTRLGVTPTTAMADIGCGTGLLACTAATMAGSVRAIDVSAAMLRAAEARARSQGLANITFEREGFLTFAGSGDLDLIVTKAALHHLPDLWKAVALTRMRDALKPAGYTLYNLRASHQWDSVRLDFGVENLTDKFYYLPTGGTYTGQGTTMGINSIPWGISVPGMGRSFYTGVNVSF